MNRSLSDRTERAFAGHDAFEHIDSNTFRLTTTAFDGQVTVRDEPESGVTSAVSVRVPTLEAATSDEVGDAVSDGWFETLSRRLEDAPKATRRTVELDVFGVEIDESARENDGTGTGTIHVTYQFEQDDPVAARDVTKTFIEYVEGTYVEGIVPGYTYTGTVFELLNSATSDDGVSEAGGTPL